MVKYRKTIVWSLMGVVIVLFWFSLRSTEHNMEFTIAAIGVWAITFLVDRQLKKQSENDEE